jgi:hypothetical protein
MVNKHSNDDGRDWLDTLIKMTTPVIVGLVVAYVGFLSNKTLSEVSNKQESARLVTELQVRREQSESELRKDIFNQTLKTFLLEDAQLAQDYSKQILRLELLALNFGDSLSLSPLFHELHRDLNRLSMSVDKAPADKKEAENLKKRLTSLAKRVASAQLSSVLQHGQSIQIRIPLGENVKKEECGIFFMDAEEYKWPDDEVSADFGDAVGLETVLAEEIALRRLVEVDGIERHVSMSFSEFDICARTIQVSLSIGEGKGVSEMSAESGGMDKHIYREFRLDFFNFPKVDNTRLGHNQRFAMMIEDFNVGESPHVVITSVIFPAEYASMRDAPSMEEALRLLETSFVEKG